MKPNIHPDYHEVTVHCACGQRLQDALDLQGRPGAVEICSSCHPFFTGKQKLLDTAGRVERFTRKYEKAAEAAQAAKRQSQEVVRLAPRCSRIGCRECKLGFRAWPRPSLLRLAPRSHEPRNL